MKNDKNKGMAINTSEQIKEKIGIAVGEASMCWSEVPKGIFDSSRAVRIIQDILDAFQIEAGMGITRYTEVKKEYHKLRAENEKLRSALERTPCQCKPNTTLRQLMCVKCDALFDEEM